MKNKPQKLQVYSRLIEYLFSNQKYDVNFSIARVMISKIHEFPDITIEEIAFLANTTPSSVTKFCKRLKYNSFKELRTDTHIYHDTDLYRNFRNIVSTKGIEDGLHYYTNEIHNIFINIFSLFDLHQIQAIARQLSKCKSAAIFSGMHGFISANLFFELMIPYEIPVFEVNRRSDIELLKAMIRSEDMVFIISLSGEWIKKYKDSLGLTKESSKKLVIITHQPLRITHPYPLENITFEKSEHFFFSNFISSNTLQAFFVLLSTYVGIELKNKEKQCIEQ